jgi:dihydroneopterin aldolase/2-amino-4-hydroxy-6-hydroxymethyldihydropteridine diphosphokinase
VSDRITLRGLRGRGRHGVLDFERAGGQVFVTDVTLELDMRAAAAGDDLTRTADYGALAAAVVQVLEGEPVDLIETLADRIARVCLDVPAVAAVEVTVHKPQAPITVPFDDVSVTIRRGRERTAVLALGSNLGDRLACLQGAVDAFALAPDTPLVACSPVYETDPVGGPEQPPYLNAVVLVSTSLTAERLLDRAGAVEAAYGRVRDEQWGPRTLDVDLITVGGDVKETPRLTLPHPRAHERAFVLAPWCDIEQDATLPGHGRVASLLELVGLDGVRRRDDLQLEMR